MGLSEISAFVDESGTMGRASRYYLLTLVFHDQGSDIRANIASYEQHLARCDLPDIPLHCAPLMQGHFDYEGIDLQTRKRLLAAFFHFYRMLPVKYHTFIYLKKDFADDEALGARMRRDIVSFLYDHLNYFQSFDSVLLYYDQGQDLVTKALHGGFEYALSKQATVYRNVSPRDYRLSQVADFLCTLELTARKFEDNRDGATDHKIFGSKRDFRRNWLRKIREKRLD